MKTILVTGVGGPAGQSVASLLLERNLCVVGTDVRDLSLPGIKFHPVPPAGAAGFLEAVHSIASLENVDAIIPTVSEELPVFASAWEWADRFPVLIGSSAAVRVANDKLLTARLLATGEVNVPRFGLPDEFQSANELDKKIGWPCISKPRVGRGGREVTWHPEEDWPIVSALDNTYIIQEFAPGTDFAPNVFLGPDGQTVVVVLEKTELKEGIVGNARSVKRVEAQDVADLAVQTARVMGLHGPMDIDIRRRSDGIPVVLEVNARFGANIRFAPEVFEAALDLL